MYKIYKMAYKSVNIAAFLMKWTSLESCDSHLCNGTKLIKLRPVKVHFMAILKSCYSSPSSFIGGIGRLIYCLFIYFFTNV